MSFELRGRVIFFATNNINKFNEARVVLQDYNVAVGMLRVKAVEVQSDSLEEIAQASAVDTFKKSNLPIIVEDAGLFIQAVNGFPGPYAAYAYKTIGNRGLLKLVENVENRKAMFRSVVAYKSRELEGPTCFVGEVAGEIVKQERRGTGKSGFGFDPVFKPAGASKTFAEMSIAEKNMYSHRASALRKFAEWYRKLR
jgi:XTP/dITP diphosphohydrolase